MTSRPNVILLSIDALRADHLGAHGYERETTPFLDKFAEQEIEFKTAISASSHTREAVPALLSGRYPDVFAANVYRYVPKTVADRLSETGYQTAGFHSNPYVSRAYGYDSGFDRFDDDLVLGRNRLIALAQRALNKFVLNRGEYHARAEEINDRSLSWLDGLSDKEPFFLWNHYMDVHGPYNPPDSFSVYTERSISNSEAQQLYQKCVSNPERISEHEHQLLMNLYDGEIRYLDAQLRKFINEIELRGLTDNTVIIITADHGDAFGEHGFYTHPRYVYNELVHVPLILSGIDISSGEIHQPVSTLSIVPTVLDLVGIKQELPHDSLFDFYDGKENANIVISSAQGENGHESIRRFAIRSKEWKYMIEYDHSSNTIASEQVFNIQNDSMEQHPVNPDIWPQKIQTLRRTLQAHCESRFTTTADETTEEADVPVEVQDRLESLGYK